MLNATTMRISLVLAVAAVASAAAIAMPDTAQAQVRVHVGGSVTIGGTVQVGYRHRGRRLRRIHRPRPVNVYYYYPTYADPPPPPAPAESCCQCTESCAPAAPAPAPQYAPPAYTPAPAVYQTYQREPRFGIGLRASSLVLDANEADEDGEPAEGMGLLLRFRLRSNVELELDIGHDKFVESNREDTRLGAALYLPLTRGRLAPYLVVGAGVNAIQIMEDADPIQQGYVEAGAGLAWKLAPRFVVSGDVRWSARKEMREEEDDSVIQASTGG